MDLLPAFVAEKESPPADPSHWSQWTEAVGGNGHYYRVVTPSGYADLQTANQLATAAGAHLATVTSAEESGFVQALVAESGAVEAWLGGLQPNPAPEDEPYGNWTWVTDEPFQFTDWLFVECGQWWLDYPADEIRDQTPVAENDDGGVGTNAQAGFTAIQDGVLSIRVSADDVETGTYTVKLREIVGDIASNASTSKDLALGKQACSAVDFANDQDWLRVQVEAGQKYVFEAKGAATGSGKLDDPTLTLVDAFGIELANGSDGGIGLNDRIVYTADTSRTLYLDIIKSAHK